jgi:hypothetical protein
VAVLVNHLPSVVHQHFMVAVAVVARLAMILGGWMVVVAVQVAAVLALLKYITQDRLAAVQELVIPVAVAVAVIITMVAVLIPVTAVRAVQVLWLFVTPTHSPLLQQP